MTSMVLRACSSRCVTRSLATNLRSSVRINSRSQSGSVLRRESQFMKSVSSDATSLPTEDARIEQASVDVFAEDSRPVILFDGVCNFCNAGVNLVLSLDQNESFRFAALQSSVGKSLLERCGKSPDDISSMVLVEKDAFYVKSDSALKIGERLRLPFPLLTALLWPLPKPIRDNGYDWIADNRYKIFGIRDECRLTDKREAQRFLS